MVAAVGVSVAVVGETITGLGIGIGMATTDRASGVEVCGVVGMVELASVFI